MKRTTLAMMMTLALTTTAVAANDWKDGAKDAWIDGKAETTLMLNGNLNSFDINTDVKNGKVTLTGKVKSDVDKALAEELIENLDGVTGVDNQLTVVNSGQNANSKEGSALKDAKIATVVKTRLLFESEVSGTSINVDAENGVVTLHGEVDSDAEKDLAVAIAKNTSDVSRVVDKLQVAK
ncbi:Osmotically-inducible protein OsmY, contains BON domain [Rheinheimera pacifica]|uniref:Osmotically-inducible protein OsmY, contains BON domain n=1 Tax=Rheinheimera pacifica TaxID=173990 RepID=A0A1H6K1M4_9GAMM|nr:BON domain-containing protein [Rheinheimera pacifica]MDR6984956.1 osmotically-inducible protein OsmY [Rheinheimera pacifica]PKM18055.1 MAG: BON domain-containing protein [Gammaproteobacteria bacterium HGW-Gammaproteobacteria-15]SEH66797.1 Osmotically-inducible protein OsmY, contains BON domain [Rheinheimera pacifica]